MQLVSAGSGEPAECKAADKPAKLKEFDREEVAKHRSKETGEAGFCCGSARAGHLRVPCASEQLPPSWHCWLRPRARFEAGCDPCAMGAPLSLQGRRLAPQVHEWQGGRVFSTVCMQQLWLRLWCRPAPGFPGMPRRPPCRHLGDLQGRSVRRDPVCGAAPGRGAAPHAGRRRGHRPLLGHVPAAQQRAGGAGHPPLEGTRRRRPNLRALPTAPGLAPSLWAPIPCRSRASWRSTASAGSRAAPPRRWPTPMPTSRSACPPSSCGRRSP